ncbi:hypothetical protein [Streptomyces sp. NPDC057257]|uniref:hypothetical protein n=1 Tax=Streptomyces sp. NPDC057257 TaxID=3346071 RepID=UPI00364577DD
MRIKLAAACLATVALLLTGCQDATQHPTGAQSGAPAGQSLWHLGSKSHTGKALPDSDPDVAAIKTLVAAQSAVVDRRTARTVAASTTKEYGFYTTRLAVSLRNENYGGKLSGLFQDNGLSTEPLKTGWYASTITQDRTSARVEMDSTFEFTAAKPAYLRANGLATNTPYTQRRVIGLKKVDGTWLIDSLQKYPLTRAPAAPGSNPAS